MTDSQRPDTGTDHEEIVWVLLPYLFVTAVLIVVYLSRNLAGLFSSAERAVVSFFGAAVIVFGAVYLAAKLLKKGGPA